MQKPTPELIEQIAQICHEANRAYCETVGDKSQSSWESAPEWQKISARNGVLFHFEYQNAGPSGSHESWMREKLAQGWVWGEVKDPEKKQHPCISPFSELPRFQQMKDFIFHGIVHAFIGGPQ